MIKIHNFPWLQSISNPGEIAQLITGEHRTPFSWNQSDGERRARERQEMHVFLNRQNIKNHNLWRQLFPSRPPQTKKRRRTTAESIRLSDEIRFKYTRQSASHKQWERELEWPVLVWDCIGFSSLLYVSTSVLVQTRRLSKKEGKSREREKSSLSCSRINSSAIIFADLIKSGRIRLHRLCYLKHILGLL